ncbi:hypothetical protein ACHHYP_16305, partial [Achlya hypogyna]
MYIMSTYLENDLFWPTFVTEGMHNAVLDFFNARLALNATSLELLNAAWALPKVYSNTPMTLAIYNTYPRLVLYSELTALDKAVVSLRELLATEVTHMITQYCWLDLSGTWELAHSVKRQQRCVANDKDNAAVYFETVLRNIDMVEWWALYKGFFTLLISSALNLTPEGVSWLKYINSHAWVPVADEVAVWQSHGLGRFQLQWTTLRQVGLSETIAIENALGMTTTITIKSITPTDRYSLWTTHSMYASFENDLGNFYFGANQSLVLNSPVWFGYTLPHAIEMYNLPYPLNPLNAALHAQLGPLASIDLKLIPPPPKLLETVATFQAALALQTAQSSAIAEAVSVIWTVKLHPTPIKWQNSSLVFFGGNPMCADGAPYAFVQESFGFDDTCAGQRPLAVTWGPANALFALSQLSTSDRTVATTTVCSTLALSAADANICAGSLLYTLKAFALFTPPATSTAMVTAVRALDLATLQFVSPTSLSPISVEMQPILDSTSPAWRLFGWMAIFEWALGQREAVAFEGDVQTLRLLSYLYDADAQVANTLDVGRSLGNYMWGLAWYVSAGLALVLICVTLALACTRHQAGPNWFMFNRIASTVWVGRPILLVRSATAILCLATAPIVLQVQGSTTSFSYATRPVLESMVLAGESLWLSYVLNEIFVHVTGRRTRHVAPVTCLAVFIAVAVVDIASPPPLVSTIGRECHPLHMDIQVVCASGSIQVGHLNRVILVVAIHLVGQLFCLVGCKLIPAVNSSGEPTVLLHGSAIVFLHNGAATKGYWAVDDVTSVLCGLIPVRIRGRRCLFDLTLWRLLEGTEFRLERNAADHFLLPDAREATESVKGPPPKLLQRTSTLRLTPEQVASVKHWANWTLVVSG